MLKVKIKHDCQKPSMIVDSKEVEISSGRWWNKKKVATTVNIYEGRQAQWDCECGARWEWSPYGEGGFWMCLSRPEVWKIVSE